MKDERIAPSKTYLLAVAVTLIVSATLVAVGAIPASEISHNSGNSGKFFNPLQLALLYWYPANLTTTFAVGSNPTGIAFDGANIWVTNYGSNTVSELRANDGSMVGSFAVGTNPYGVAFDGANIWWPTAMATT